MSNNGQTSHRIEEQVTSFTVQLQTPYDQRTTKQYLIIITLILIVSSVIALLSHDQLTSIIVGIIQIAFLSTTLALCNNISLKHSLQNFAVIYQISNTAVGAISIVVINNQWKNWYDVDSIIVSCYITSSLFTIKLIMIMTVIAIINDGYNIDLTSKIVFSMVNIGLCGYYFYSAIIVSQDSNQDKDLYITKDYTIGWRLIALSSFSTVIIFTIKQIYSIIRYPNQFSSIICYFPIIGIEMFDTIEKDSSECNNDENNNGIRSSTVRYIEMTQMNAFDLTRPNSVTKYDYNSSIDHSIDIVYETGLSGGGGLGLTLLDLHKQSTYSETLDIFDSTAETSPIYVNKDYTLWFVVFHKLFRFKFDQSLKYHRIMTQNKIVQALVVAAMLSLFVVHSIEGDTYICHMTFWKISFRFFVGIAFLTAFLMGNVSCMLYALKTNFSIYWRCYDAIATRLCALFISLKHGNCASTLKSKDELTIMIVTVIWGCIFVSVIFVNGVSMIQAYVNVHFVFQIAIVVICLSIFVLTALSRIIDNQQSIYGFEFGDNYHYSIDFSNFVLVKAIDVSIWFLWQLYVMFRHGNKIRVANANREWVVIAKS